MNCLRLSLNGFKLLRKISILFTDAAPSSTPYLSHGKMKIRSTTCQKLTRITWIDDRRFVRDEHVIHCLRQISRHGNIKEIEVNFYGRKCLVRHDYRFLDALREIKADKVLLENSERAWYSSKVDFVVKMSLMDTMVRPRKLYEHEHDLSE